MADNYWGETSRPERAPEAFNDFGQYPYADILNFKGQYRDADAAFYGMTPEVQKLMDEGAIKRNVMQGINESGEFDYVQDDWNLQNPAWNNLPKSTLPTVQGGWSPLAQGGNRGYNLLDPSMIHVDPNYGEYTPTRNVRPPGFDWHDLIGPIAMAAITFGASAIGSAAAAAGTAAAGAAQMGGSTAASIAGGLGGGAATTASTVPWYINLGMSVARQVGGGNPTALGIGTSLIPGLQEFGIPTWATGAAQSAASFWNQSQNGGPTQQEQQAPISAAPASTMYNPAAYGNMGVFGDMAAYGGFGTENGGGFNVEGSMPAVGDGSQRVATAIAPGAYANSYNQINT